MLSRKLLLLLVALIATTASAKPVKLNQLISDGQQNLTVNGNDSFIVAMVDPNKPQRDNKSNILNIAISEVETAQDALKLELFYHSVNIENATFAPHHRAKYIVDKNKITPNGIFLSFPENVDVSSLNLLRLDFENCGDCQFKAEVDNIFKLSNQSISKDNIVEPLRVYTGTTTLNAEERSLFLGDWKVHHIEGTAASFKINDHDPFLISPSLRISTEEIAGVYVKLKTDLPSVDYQLFFATEEHRFIEAVSTVVRVQTQPNQYSEFFIPLGHLSNGFPPRLLLDGIRIDIVVPDPEKVAEFSNTQWTLSEVKVIPFNKLKEYKDLRPDRIVQHKDQRSSKKQLLIGSVKRITSDLGFIIAFLILLVINSGFIVRIYRRRNQGET